MRFSILKYLKKANEFASKDGGCGHGQIFDKASYVGNLRGITFFLLVIYVGGHVDDIGRWLFQQFGSTLIVSPGQEAWHSMIARAIGIIGVVSGLINIYNVYTKREKISSTDTARDQ